MFSVIYTFVFMRGLRGRFAKWEEKRESTTLLWAVVEDEGKFGGQRSTSLMFSSHGPHP
jgi:hypothetical protein